MMNQLQEKLLQEFIEDIRFFGISLEKLRNLTEVILLLP